MKIQARKKDYRFFEPDSWKKSKTAYLDFFLFVFFTFTSQVHLNMIARDPLLPNIHNLMYT